MEKAFSVFGLTTGQTQILFSLQKLIVQNDIAVTANNKKVLINSQKKADVKQQWLDVWQNSINDYLSHLDDSKLCLLNTYGEIEQKIATEDNNTESNIWKYLVLLECVFFKPYFAIGETKEEKNKNGKLFAGQKLEDSSRTQTLLVITQMLNIDFKYVGIFEKTAKKAYKNISGYWKKFAIGSAIAFVVAIALLVPGAREIVLSMAPSGLTGVAAFNAGLAALGGGAIAAGGFGMAGGIAVLVGGGSLLSVGVAGSVGIAIASMMSNVVLNEAVKFEVVLREIVLAIQKDTISFQEILNKLAAEKEALKNELKELKKSQKENKIKIKELEKSVEYLEKLLKNLRS